MHIQMRRHNTININVMCLICGEEFELGDVVFEVDCGEPEKYHNASVGFVCYTCIELDAEGRQEGLRAHASWLRERAEEPDEIAAEMEEVGLSEEDAKAYAAWKKEWEDSPFEQDYWALNDHKPPPSNEPTEDAEEDDGIPF